jgi:hypothetical protein
MITDEQRYVIGIIEKNLGIKFKGSTTMEAIVFISTNMEKSRKATQNHKAFTRQMYPVYPYVPNEYECADAIANSNDNVRRLDKQEFDDWCFGSRNNREYVPYSDDDYRPW